MTEKEPRGTYTLAYSLLHWTIALCIILLFSMQYIRKPFDEDVRNIVREFHKSIGLVTIVLIALRLWLRLTTQQASKFDDTAKARTLVAKAVHQGLWMLMIFVPLTGLGFLLMRGRGVDFFLLAALGPFTSGSQFWGSLTLILHRYAAFVLIGLVVLHCAGALFHHFVLRDGLMTRMAPFASGRVWNKNGR